MRIVKAKRFVRQHAKLPIKAQKQFANRLKLYLENKDHILLNVHNLKGEYTGLQSFNVTADIRAIIDTSIAGIIILVAIGTHSELYG